MKNQETIEATANYSKRTFTLRVYSHGVLHAKYRTFKLNQDEFNSCEFNTQNDWKQFFKSDEYYIIK